MPYFGYLWHITLTNYYEKSKATIRAPIVLLSCSSYGDVHKSLYTAYCRQDGESG